MNPATKGLIIPMHHSKANKNNLLVQYFTMKCFNKSCMRNNVPSVVIKGVLSAVSMVNIPVNNKNSADTTDTVTLTTLQNSKIISHNTFIQHAH